MSQIRIPNLENKKILLATPAYDGKVGVDFVNSLVASLLALRAAGAEVHYAIYANSANVPRVRNTAVAAMMGEDFTDIVFIDADMQWDATDLAKVCAYDTSIVGAPYRARTDNNARWIVVWDDEVRQHEASGLLTAKRAGTGFLRIRRDVFEKLEELHPYLHYAGPHVTEEHQKPHLFAFFDYTLKTGNDGVTGHLSEDYYFCDLAREAGFTIWMDPNVNLGHIGSKTWSGKFVDDVKIASTEENEAK